MRVFLCWSGTSNVVALLLKEWIEHVAGGAVDAFISHQISGGENWLTTIRKELESARGAILCLNPQNVASTWMHFEAGAIASAVGNRVYPYLINLATRDLAGPLQAYQATTADVPGTVKLVGDVVGWADQTDPRLAGWQARLTALQPRIEERLASLDVTRVAEVIPSFDRLFGRLTFEEPLDECQNQNWLQRLIGVGETLNQLEGAREKVVASIPWYTLRWFDDLIIELKRYAGSMQSLVAETHYPTLDGIKYAVPKEILLPSERARKRILDIAEELRSPPRAPILPDAAEYYSMRDAERQRRLIIQAENTLRNGGIDLGFGRADRLRQSDWSFDRIVYYRAWEVLGPPPDSGDNLLLSLQQYAEKPLRSARGTDWLCTSYALWAAHYALDKAAATISDQAKGQLHWALQQIENSLQSCDSPAEAREVQDALEQVRKSPNFAKN
jgi:hypothetical protein